MSEIVSIGEKGQIVLPKRIREDFKLTKGTKLLISEDGDRITTKPVKLDEDHILMLLRAYPVRNK